MCHLFFSIGPLHWCSFSGVALQKKPTVVIVSLVFYLLIIKQHLFIYVFLMGELTHLKKSDKYFQIKH